MPLSSRDKSDTFSTRASQWRTFGSEVCSGHNIAYVAYGPRGHGWLVDDFPYQTPDDFELDDYRRESMYVSILFLAKVALLTPCSSPEVPRQELLRQQENC